MTDVGREAAIPMVEWDDTSDTENSEPAEQVGADVQSTLSGRYDPENYQTEKILGVRRSTGEKNLKKLTAVHRKMIAMHIRGLSNRDIAFITGRDEISVGRVLRDPLSKEYIDIIIHENVDMELSALGPMAVNAVRQGLENADDRIALLAADRFFRATGRYNREPVGQESAEDVIKRALALAEGSQQLAKEALARKGDDAKVIDLPSDRFTKLPDT